MSRPGVNVIGFVCRVACGRRLGRAIKRSFLFRLELLTDRAAGIRIRATAIRSGGIASYIGKTAADGRAMASDIQEIGICSREIAADSQEMPSDPLEIGICSRRRALRSCELDATTRFTSIVALSVPNAAHSCPRTAGSGPRYAHP